MPFWRKKKPVTSGEVPLATVILPTVGDPVVLSFVDHEVTAHVAEVTGDGLSVKLGEESSDLTFPNPAIRIRWKEHGGRRLLEANARVDDALWVDEQVLGIVELGTAERSDRRAYVRAQIRTRITLVKSSQEKPVRATSLDMSETSIAFELDPTTENPLEPGDTLRIAFTIDEDPFAFGGQVLRIDRRRIVVMFPNIASRERDALRFKILAATVRKS